MWQKPKGMHWETFERRVARAQALEQLRDAAFCMRVEAFLQQMEGR
jgi:hypothetical protein